MAILNKQNYLLYQYTEAHEVESIDTPKRNSSHIDDFFTSF